ERALNVDRLTRSQRRRQCERYRRRRWLRVKREGALKAELHANKKALQAQVAGSARHLAGGHIVDKIRTVNQAEPVGELVAATDLKVAVPPVDTNANFGRGHQLLETALHIDVHSGTVVICLPQGRIEIADQNRPIRPGEDAKTSGSFPMAFAADQKAAAV